MAARLPSYGTWTTKKISHKDPEKVTVIITYIKSIYGTMTVKIGKKNTYLVMEIDLSDIGKAKICMGKYIDKSMEEFTEDVSTSVSSPASDYLLNTIKVKFLPEDQTFLPHRLMAKLIFVSKRAWTDIQITIGFLSTHVCEPNKDDWKKLHQLIQ